MRSPNGSFPEKQKESIGAVPGAPVFIGTKKIERPYIKVIDYDANSLEEKELSPKECANYTQTKTVSWITLHGLHDASLIKEIGDAYHIHPLALEDILNTGQRPKVEEYDNSLFIVIKMLKFDTEFQRTVSDQLSFVLGENYLLSFHEKPVDVFEPVRERIRKHRGRIRNLGVDYLAYAILDTIVDNYIFAIEALGAKIEDNEEKVLANPSNEVLEEIRNHKHEVNYLRKSIRPARELIMQLIKDDSDLISDQIHPFLKDLQDLASQATEALDSYREMLSDQLNIYNTSISNKLNEIMKVLTIFAAIFIPLTFIAGIYGTNFEYLPELKFKYSYFIFWVVMISVAAVMVRFFKKKDWI